MDKIVYVDHNATTYVEPKVLNDMLPYFTEKFGNASSNYLVGRVARAAVQKARGQVAKAINCNLEEIYFTSGASESNNLILLGIARANKQKGKHIITSKIEHDSVLNTCKQLEKEGFLVTYLNVDKNGIININELISKVRSDTIIISVMVANNEIGTIQPINQIGYIANTNNIIFHTDAVCGIGNILLDTKALNISALSLTAHKFYGPKGIGVAYIKDKIMFEPLIHGGHQENSKRAGTENVPAIVGLGSAIEIANENIEEHNNKLFKLREAFITRLEQNIDGVIVHGDRQKRVSGNANITIKNFDSKALVLILDINGICASTGSACNTGKNELSHVLKAIGMNNEILPEGSFRISFGKENTMEDVEYIVNIITKIVNEKNNSNSMKNDNNITRSCY